MKGGRKVTLKFVAKFYFRRYWRITIPLMLIMLFCVGLNKYVHSGKSEKFKNSTKILTKIFLKGPFYSEFYENSQNGCPTGFWTNLLYINNLKNEVLV
jgi:energy-coupling factor transporter transmembrane protein EcfT